MVDHAEVLARNLRVLGSARVASYRSSLARDARLQRLIADLVAARRAAGMTQQAVAAQMCTTKSVVCRLETGKLTRPTLRTITLYVWAVDARMEIRVRCRVRASAAA